MGGRRLALAAMRCDAALPATWSLPKWLSVTDAGPVLTHIQYYLYPLLQIGSEQSLICQHRLPTLRCHQPPLLPCSVTCLSEM